MTAHVRTYTAIVSGAPPPPPPPQPTQSETQVSECVRLGIRLFSHLRCVLFTVFLPVCLIVLFFSVLSLFSDCIIHS